ncbi:MAG: four helix bundle protein [Gemmatimonadaceae bacterium]
MKRFCMRHDGDAIGRSDATFRRVSGLIRSYKDLDVWQRSVELFVRVTGLVRTLPTADRFVFETQTRKAARSVAANISEGHQRRHLGDYLRLLSYSRGSLGEVETDLVLIERTTSAPRSDIADCAELADEVGRKLSRLRNGLRSRSS